MFNRPAALGLSLLLSACNFVAAPGAPAADSAAPEAAATPQSPGPAPQAASPAPKLTIKEPADGPPTVGGIYVYLDCEGEGGCPHRNWRTQEPTPILAAQDPEARALATLAPGEWVSVEIVETRLVPVRGVVLENSEDLSAGEVIYQLEYEGEGFTTIWRRGEFGTLAHDGPRVEWETPVIPAEAQATLGLWARVKRENGETGWVRDPRFECMGTLGGDEDCRG